MSDDADSNRFDPLISPREFCDQAKIFAKTLRRIELSRGNRPAHKAGKLTGSGIDSPDSVKFRKHKDYR
jgi:hypothetical protein